MAETWFSHHVLSCTSRHRNAWFVSYRKGDAAKGRRYWPVFPSMHHPRRVRRTCQFIGTAVRMAWCARLLRGYGVCTRVLAAHLAVELRP